MEESRVALCGEKNDGKRFDYSNNSHIGGEVLIRITNGMPHTAAPAQVHYDHSYSTPLILFALSFIYKVV
jgi:hypothetical protein